MLAPTTPCNNGAIFLSVAALFQLRLRRVADCVTWVVSNSLVQRRRGGGGGVGGNGKRVGEGKEVESGREERVWLGREGKGVEKKGKRMEGEWSVGEYYWRID